MRRVFDLGRILPPLCRPAPPPLLPDLFPDPSAWGATAAPPASARVGLGRVAAAAHGEGQHVWVVSHLSDSVSIVDVSSSPPRVVRTLLVGDEPRDLVFAGPGGNRAFITSAHRGQNSGVPLADFTTAGLGRADVWVFDVTNLGSTLRGPAP